MFEYETVSEVCDRVLQVKVAINKPGASIG